MIPDIRSEILYNHKRRNRQKKPRQQFHHRKARENTCFSSVLIHYLDTYCSLLFSEKNNRDGSLYEHVQREEKPFYPAAMEWFLPVIKESVPFPTELMWIMQKVPRLKMESRSKYIVWIQKPPSRVCYYISLVSIQRNFGTNSAEICSHSAHESISESTNVG